MQEIELQAPSPLSTFINFMQLLLKHLKLVSPCYMVCGRRCLKRVKTKRGSEKKCYRTIASATSVFRKREMTPLFCLAVRELLYPIVSGRTFVKNSLEA